MISAINWQSSMPSYVACGSLQQHNATGTALVTFIASSSTGSKNALTEPEKIAIAVAGGLVILGAIVGFCVCWCRRRAAASANDGALSDDTDRYSKLMA